MAATNKPCILVVDDHESIRKYLRMYLEMLGFDVLTAESGAEGIERAQSCPLTAAFIDITLPDTDGFAVAQALRQIPALAHTRLFAITGYDLSPEPDKLAKAGFEKWLHKPFNADELEKLLQNLLSSAAIPPPNPPPAHPDSDSNEGT
jgi:CheY-like chemotaxis protein